MSAGAACRNCASTEHFVRDCPKIVCHACGRSGHFQTNCPSTGTSGSYQRHGKRERSQSLDSDDRRYDGRRDASCFACGAPGHTRAHCPQRERDERCFNCGQGGHIMSRCPRGDLRGRCFHCAEEGHQSAQCPYRSDEGGRLCYQCHQPGHYASSCPKGVRCHACGEVGHMQARCPQPVCNACHERGHFSTDCPVSVSSSGAAPRPFGQDPPRRLSAQAAPGGTGSFDCGDDLIEQPSAAPAAAAAAMRPMRDTDGASSVASIRSGTGSGTPSEAAAAAVVGNPQLQPPPLQQPPPQPSAPHTLAAQVAPSQVGDAHVAVPPFEPSPNAVRRRGRVAVVIDGAYFERCISGCHRKDILQYAKCKELLKYTLDFLGNLFEMAPIAYWFDTDPQRFSSFVEATYHNAHHRDTILRENDMRRRHLLDAMNGTKELSNVVAKLVGGMKRQRGFTTDGMGHVWVQTGVDVSIATCVIECFQDRRQYQQVVLISGDSDLYPCVHYCNQTRRGLPAEVPPVRVCGTGNTISRLYGQHQDLSDFLPRILLDEPLHNENAASLPFPVANFFR